MYICPDKLGQFGGRELCDDAWMTYMCNELGEVNAGWIPARPASVDQDCTRNNRHNPLMV